MSLTSARADLAALLEPSGLTVDDHVPDLVSPPCVVIEPGDPYITYGDTFDPDEITVCLDVYVLVDLIPAAAEEMALELDEAIRKVYPLLGEWIITRTSKPGPWHVGDELAYGIRLTVENITSNEGTNA